MNWNRRVRSTLIVRVAAGILAVWLFGTEAFALEQISKCDWAFMRQYKQLSSGHVVEVQGQRPILELEAKPGEKMLPITTVMNLPITKRFYVLHGMIKYENVGGKGYMEMWSHIDEERRFFSRTLDGSGPMGVLTGSSGWRPFCIPASLLEDPSAPLPKGLEINLHLPEGGKVWLSELTLSQGDAFEIPGAVDPWWSSRTSGWIGGIGGALLGTTAALAGWLATRPGTLKAAVIMLRSLIAVSGISLAFTVYAMVLGQPWHVTYPLGLLGVIGVGVLWGRLREAEQRMSEIELRKVAAMDAV